MTARVSGYTLVIRRRDDAFRTYFSKYQPAFGGVVCPKANEKEFHMASKLKIIPLGGLGEIGKNLTIYE
ncbi:MAG: hypothetical protein UET87_04790, partial [Oscillospiraceae bacterium]|nr:hypothetical protein [Oscillospiraceae bacterium]